MLPFSRDQFLDVFASYNALFWPVACGFWLLAAWALASARRRPALLTWTLAALWGWNAAAYHALLFTRINPAAWIFAVFFAVEAMLLAVAARRGVVEYVSGSRLARTAGGALALYALAYPAISVTLVHAYPATPTFGVPCPTALLTIGALLTSKRMPIWLSVVPVLWGFVGGSAAVLLDVPTDFVLLAAGVAGAAALGRQGLTRPR